MCLFFKSKGYPSVLNGLAMTGNEKKFLILPSNCYNNNTVYYGCLEKRYENKIKTPLRHIIYLNVYIKSIYLMETLLYSTQSAITSTKIY